MKTRLFYVLFIFSSLSILLGACAGQPPVLGEKVNGYWVDDATCNRAGMTWEECLVYYASLPGENQTIQSEDQDPEEEVEESDLQLVSYELTTDMVWCDKAVAGDSIGSMATAAYGGTFPPYDLNGIAMQIAHYSDEDVEVFTLQHLFLSPDDLDYQASPTISVDDWACLSLNGEKLKVYTPGE